MEASSFSASSSQDTRHVKGEADVVEGPSAMSLYRATFAWITFAAVSLAGPSIFTEFVTARGCLKRPGPPSKSTCRSASESGTVTGFDATAMSFSRQNNEIDEISQGIRDLFHYVCSMGMRQCQAGLGLRPGKRKSF
jgi:hypothetical protein